ncbi:hypothetical protein PR202_ga23685 [Eleusine coracana subsp. coracana]|uniref:Glycosyltransferase 61 catalytic domain-containing protein n=1 Tax=Eleusine coracana subsp. coracana TaxID=191504 RepID=A0AAV5D5V4_ELECO|nr:hypothetical protein PR202_ga23685 [Eleusine coracana subsp. coracana]
MRCSEVKTGRCPKGGAQRYFLLGFVAGILLVLLTYLVSQQFSISSQYVVITPARRITDKQKVNNAPEETKKSTVVCNTEGSFSESCEADGDVRVHGTSLSVSILPTRSRSSERREWRIRAHARKSVDNIKKVTVKQLPDPAAAPPCTVTYTAVPAILFAIGGHSGRNYWHDFADVLGLCVLFVGYEFVDLDSDAHHVRCFPHVTVGIRIDKEFTIVPELSPAVRLSREQPGKRPRLLLIHRGHYRRLVNEQEIARAAEAAGFDAVVTELRGDTAVGEQARVVNSFDALLGVHGAGLTNAAFLPPGGVLIQVVPYGKMEFIARAEFSDPATDMGLKYLDYSVSVEESTLLEMLGPEHPVIKDPDSVHRSGWAMIDEYYLRKQDVRINVTRFAPTLAMALDHLLRRRQQ